MRPVQRPIALRADGRPPAVLLVGGSSDIGRAVLDRLLPAEPAHVVLAGRPSPRLTQAAAWLARVHTVVEVGWSATHGPEPSELLRKAASACDGRLDLVVVAVGSLDESALDRATQVNFLAPAAVVLAAVRQLEPYGGRIVVLSSASAVRPRRSLCMYSVAKQALDSLCRMVDDESPQQVRVHVVRPGHVRTAMTAGLPVPPLANEPTDVAEDVARGIAAGRRVIWSPPVMRWVMAALRVAPRRLLPDSLR
ncbi:SDR family NAD(P)-dependent oxidoreductase [Angustibacter sp. McL0619]|uniref:SDR family NAD(P)-dependent oxidoreductase n=1 Tax=Angustibacter sp. McL0619 TaxID=3415676 RepID=UPI003CF29173